MIQILALCGESYSIPTTNCKNHEDDGHLHLGLALLALLPGHLHLTAAGSSYLESSPSSSAAAAPSSSTTAAASSSAKEATATSSSSSATTAASAAAVAAVPPLSSYSSTLASASSLTQSWLLKHKHFALLCWKESFAFECHAMF